ncbi:hypothetical protein DER45DRAFT_602303, partial [Fusarium avenaceum]
MATRRIQPQDELPKPDTKAFGILSCLKTKLNQQIPNTLPRKDYANAILEIWKAALYLLDSNHPELHQEVARELVAKRQHSVCVETFILILAHPSLLNCPAVESCVQGIYACVAGEGGEHGIGFLSRACISRLARLEKYSGTLSSEDYNLISSIARACHELACRTPRIQTRNSRPAFLVPLSKLVTRMDEKFPKTNLGGLHSSLDMGAGTLETSGDGPCDDLPLFSIIADKPGGRHDNDFADISEIFIFPTVDEIKRQHARYIDSMFRLLRHDTIGPVIGVLRELLGSDDPMAGRCTVDALYLDTKEGPHAPTQCQIRWWINSTRLEKGRLLCFVSSEAGCQNILFFQAAYKHSSKDCLISDGESLSITAKLVCPQRSSFSQLARLFSNKTSGVLVDFNGILPETFLPVFKNLQRIRLDNHLPFYKWLVPTTSEVGDIPPPLYARHAGFTFPLGCIAKNHGTELSLDPTIEFQRADLTELAKHTGLDNGQCQGLVAALSREYALIQGPPGTGKSYLGVQLVRVLLAVREQAKLGPIVVCCHTNHALDQFLKHLDTAGVDGIVRIGNRGTAPELESKNLRQLKSEAPLTTIERRDLEILNQKEANRRKQTQETTKDLQRTCEGPQDSHLLNYIAKTRPDIHRQLVKKGRVSVTPQADIHNLSSAERWALLNHWIGEFYQQKVDVAFESVMEAELHRKNVGKIFDTVEQRILSKAHIIGITTSTVARKIDLFKSVSPKVMICEEAAEVLEPYFVSTLVPGLEHLIQIGDHKQLRPHINNHKLGVESDTEKKWQLDRSQFERRANGEPGLSPVPFAQLNVQRRMRPEISKLIKRLYPDLRDHSITMDHTDVAGMRHNLFWLDHGYPEDAQYKGRHAMSHRNRWEAKMATALVRHLVRQGEYKAGDIALLTPYIAQLSCLSATLVQEDGIFIDGKDEHDRVSLGEHDEGQSVERPIKKENLLDGVRLATIDNFQGEEAKVVVVSLVRSNPKHKIGFLKTENRVNVLLSRARDGLYLIGNTKTYRQVPMWADVGTKLELCCPRHPETTALCSEPGHFDIMSPQDGCEGWCHWPLEPCGHMCAATCHSEAMHQAYSCPELCPRVRETCKHKCPKLCGESCGPCIEPVHDIMLRCGHIKESILCHQTLGKSLVECKTPVDKEVPTCGHIISVACSDSVTSKGFSCPLPCTYATSCSHACTQTCGQCSRNPPSFIHPFCNQVCARPHRSCNHSCMQECHDPRPCGDCQEPCEVQCSHSRCSNDCSQQCKPCIESCTWACPHQRSCSMPCSAPCDRLPCEKRCEKTLACGHQCPSFCGEKCPNDYCQTCSDKKAIQIDCLGLRPYSEVKLDKNPILVLGCGHFFTGQALDGLVGLDEVYSQDQDGQFVGLKDISGSLSVNLPFCPECKCPLRQFAVRRYNRIVNRAVMDDICRNFLIQTRDAIQQLEKDLRSAEKELIITRATVSSIAERHSKLEELRKSAALIKGETLSVAKQIDKEQL